MKKLHKEDIKDLPYIDRLKYRLSWDNLWTQEIKPLLIILAIALTIRTILFQPFIIPTGSMIPSLLIGDMPVVTKFSYGYSNYSIPLIPPIFENRVGSDARPVLGDVVVFTYPQNTNLDYIKRCVGLPGDRVQMKNGVLHINGIAAKLRHIRERTELDEQGQLLAIQEYMETLPNGREHLIQKIWPFGQGKLDNTPEYTVPAGHYFMVGDNRDNSEDSREFNKLGFVPEKYLIGRADVIMFSTTAKLFEPWTWLRIPRFSRTFNKIV